MKSQLSEMGKWGKPVRGVIAVVLVVALAWLLAREDRSMIPIPGTRSMEHMRENAGAGDIVLDDGTVAALDELINEDTVAGDRYIEKIMDSIDSEKD